MEVRMYRNLEHPDLQQAIREELALNELNVELAPVVTGLMGMYGATIEDAIHMIQRAYLPESMSRLASLAE